MDRLLVICTMLMAGFALASLNNCLGAPKTASQRVRLVETSSSTLYSPIQISGLSETSMPANAMALFHAIRKLEQLHPLRPTEAGKELSVQFTDSPNELLRFESNGLFVMTNGPERRLFDQVPALRSRPTNTTIVINISPTCGITTQMVQQFFGKPTKIIDGAAAIVDYNDRCDYWGETLYVYEHKRGFTEYTSAKLQGSAPHKTALSTDDEYDGKVIRLRICDQDRYPGNH